MEAYAQTLLFITSIGAIIIGCIAIKNSLEKERLEKEFEEKSKECELWKARLFQELEKHPEIKILKYFHK